MDERTWELLGLAIFYGIVLWACYIICGLKKK